MRVKLTRRPPYIQIEDPESDIPTPIGPPNSFSPKHTCKFIYGDVRRKAWMCCGHPVHERGSPWCKGHLKVVFNPTQTAKKPVAQDSPRAESTPALQHLVR